MLILVKILVPILTINKNPKAAKEQKGRKLNLDRLVLILFVILGGGVVILSARLSLGNLHNPGPGFMPFLLGISMVFLSVLSCLEISPVAADEKKKSWHEEKPILFIFAGLIIYLSLMDLLGFYITTFLLLGYLMRVCGEERYRRIFWISGATVVVVYGVFSKIFLIPFPEGFLGI